MSSGRLKTTLLALRVTPEQGRDIEMTEPMGRGFASRVDALFEAAPQVEERW